MLGWIQKSWAWPSELKALGVIGINRRNLQYLFPNNPRSAYKLVDDKILTKSLCHQCHIPTPETYTVVERFGDLKNLPQLLVSQKQFVAKPAGGAGGRGILIITEHDGQIFQTAKGQTISLVEVRYHISSTLSGLYSLGGQPDRVLIEQRIIPHPCFSDITVQGTPDIRIILYHKIPVSAMLRLPTRASRGRANLHQGALAAGIDLKTGRTTGGVCQNRAVRIHPDTQTEITRRTIPHWQHILDIAASLAQATTLGYLGVDIVLDESRGPLVLEANARPGLAIQIANQRGLLSTLL